MMVREKLMSNVTSPREAIRGLCVSSNYKLAKEEGFVGALGIESQGVISGLRAKGVESISLERGCCVMSSKRQI